MRKENEKNTQPAVFYQISGLLKKAGVDYKIFDIKPEYTDNKVSKITGTQPSQEAKTLVVIGNNENPLLVVIARLNNVNLNSLKRDLSLNDIRMATPEEVKKHTRTEVGAVSPLCNLNLPVYVDSNLGQQTEIAFGSGLRTKIILMSFEDFKKILNPTIGSYIKE